MYRLRLLSFIVVLLVIASLLIACDASAVPATPTTAPTSTPQPPTATPLSSESRRPTTASEVPRISAGELKERLDKGDAILVVDSRDEVSYGVKHIAGAISVPYVSVESRLDELPRDQEIVFYCT